jgi:hypothetical protein
MEQTVTGMQPVARSSENVLQLVGLWPVRRPFLGHNALFY